MRLAGGQSSVAGVNNGGQVKNHRYGGNESGVGEGVSKV